VERSATRVERSATHPAREVWVALRSIHPTKPLSHDRDEPAAPFLANAADGA
jgi:hypothetical protein